jgi:hypothetical protein
MEIQGRVSSRTPGNIGRIGHWLAMGLVGLAILAVYYPTLNIYFLGDDFGHVNLYSHPSLKQIETLLSGDQTQGIWGVNQQEFRPLGGLSFMADFLISRTNPIGFHVTALMLHIASALAVFWIAKDAIGLSLSGAVFAALLFAILPIHSESVAWITGSKSDLMPSTFYLAGFAAFTRLRATRSTYWLLPVVFGFVGASMSKETVVTFPLMIASYDLLRRGPQSFGISRTFGETKGLTRLNVLLPHVLVGVLFVVYLAVRWTIFPSVLRNENWAFNFHAASASMHGLLAESGRLASKIAGLHAFNVKSGLLDAPVWVIGILMGISLAWAVSLIRGYPGPRAAIGGILYFGGFWYVVTCLPMLATYHSLRHLYIPAVGPCIALGYLAAPPGARLPSWRKLVQGTSGLAFLILTAGLLWAHNATWVQAGRISARLMQEFPAAIAAAPKDALVVAWVPVDVDKKAFVWPWVMPYALQTPWISGDLYSHSRIIEPPLVYCCGLGEWWQGKRSILSSVLLGSPDQAVKMYRVTFDNKQDRVTSAQRAVSKESLRALVEGSIGGALESTTSISYKQAMDLMRGLLDIGGDECCRMEDGAWYQWMSE